MRPGASPEPAQEHSNPIAEFMREVAQGKLTNREADELRPQLIEAILATCDTIDDSLSETNRHKAKAEIWSTLDRDDATTLTDALLMLGRKSGPAAAVVRAVAQGYLGIRALTILIPRSIQTAKWYPDHGGFKL